jgi:glucose/mannose-6-phosphate isomerase
MLDDQNVLKQRDPSGALEVARDQYQQTLFPVEIRQPEHDGRAITQVIVAGMGGSALAALLAKVWLRNELVVPFEIIRDYELPASVNSSTLVIASSYSGNTEETLSSLAQAREQGAEIAIIASGGALIEQAIATNAVHVALPGHLQPRMAVIYNLRALTALLAHFGLVSYLLFDEIAQTADWLHEQTAQWASDIPVAHNYAKQLALQAVGKTPIFYGGSLTGPVAYKWKISWNENAKNVAVWNQYPEVSHNEFMGWTSHPIEKPFAIFDLRSPLEHAQIQRRFDITDKLLSGKRPKATPVPLQGTTLIAQLLWGSILADFVSIYVAILNGVDPTPVPLIEKLKAELA